MSKYGIALAKAGLSLIMAGQASAAVTTFSFDGTALYRSTKGSYETEAAGSKVGGSISFDSADLALDLQSPGIASAIASNASYIYTSDYYGTVSGTSNFNFNLENSKVSTQGIDSYFVQDQALGGFQLWLKGSLFAGNSLSFSQPIVGLPTYEDLPYLFINGGYLYFKVNQLSMTAPVPEPETYAMLLAGLGLIGAVARRRKAKAV